MAGRPATLLESILGVEKAKACEVEIQNRIHPDDEPSLRLELIYSILTRYSQESKPKIYEILQLIPSDKAKMIYNDALRVLMDRVMGEVSDNYPVNK